MLSPPLDSIASDMKMWTVQEEAQRLAERFNGVNRAKFARDHQVPGGQAMIYQHINGVRPMSLAAAKAYARGFGCKLAEISPRLAEEVRGLEVSDSPRAVGVPVSDWPFSFTLEQFRRLPIQMQAKAEGFIEGLLAQAAAQEVEEKKSTAQAERRAAKEANDYSSV